MGAVGPAGEGGEGGKGLRRERRLGFLPRRRRRRLAVVGLFAACVLADEIGERDDPDAAGEEGGVVLGIEMAIVVVEAENEADGHVREQVGVE
jgi:hypothetical protein